MRKNSLLFLLATTFFTTGITLINDGPKDEWASALIKDDDTTDEEWKGLIRNWTEDTPNRTESINSQADENTIQLGVEYDYLFQGNSYNYLFKSDYYAGGLYRGITLKKYYLFNIDD